MGRWGRQDEPHRTSHGWPWWWWWWCTSSSITINLSYFLFFINKNECSFCTHSQQTNTIRLYAISILPISCSQTKLGTSKHKRLQHSIKKKKSLFLQFRQKKFVAKVVRSCVFFVQCFVQNPLRAGPDQVQGSCLITRRLPPILIFQSIFFFSITKNESTHK